MKSQASANVANYRKTILLKMNGNHMPLSSVFSHNDKPPEKSDVGTQNIEYASLLRQN